MAVCVHDKRTEAARELIRCHEQTCGDLRRARHHVEAAAAPRTSVLQGCPWTRRRHRWLARQRFEHAASELVFADYMSTVEPATARKPTQTERLSGLATEPDLWLTV